MSRFGLLIECSEQAVPVNGSGYLNGSDIAVGEGIQVTIHLPALQSITPRCIYCRGQVIRVENGEGGTQMAVSIQTMQFRNSNMAEFVQPAQQSTAFLM